MNSRIIIASIRVCHPTFLFPLGISFSSGLDQYATTNIDIGLGPLESSVPASEQNVTNQTFDRSRNNIQASNTALLLSGQHSLIGGFDYLTGPGVSQRINKIRIDTTDISALQALDPTLPASIVDTAELRNDFRSPQWNYSFYLLDYWRPHKDLVLELGLMKDFNKTVIPSFQGNVYQSMWSPRLGANYQFRVNGTNMSCGPWRALFEHPPGTQPCCCQRVAGFPWAIDSPSGTEIRQTGGHGDPVERQTFTVLRLGALRLATPLSSS